MHFPLTCTKSLHNPLDCGFFESLITQFEIKLEHEANLLSLNNTLNITNIEKNFSENQNDFVYSHTKNPEISGLDILKSDQAQFSGLSGQPSINPYATQLGNKVYFVNFINNFSNSNMNNLNILNKINIKDNLENNKFYCENLNLKEDLFKTKNSNLNMNYDYAFLNPNLNGNEAIETEDDNLKLISKVGFLNDCTGEKTAPAENSQAQKNLELSKNLDFLPNTNFINKNNLFKNNKIISYNNHSINNEFNSLADSNEVKMGNLIQEAATAEKSKLIIAQTCIAEKAALSVPSLKEFNKLHAFNKQETFFLGKKLNRTSPKTSEAKIESTDNDSDEVKKQPKVIYKNRKYVFTHKDNKAIEDSFKKVEKKVVNNSASNHSSMQKNLLEKNTNYEKSKFYFNFKKENNEKLIVKAVFAICKADKMKPKNSLLSYALDRNFDDLRKNSINETCKKNKNYYLQTTTYKSNYNNNLLQEKKLNGNLNFNAVDGIIQGQKLYNCLKNGIINNYNNYNNSDFYGNCINEDFKNDNYNNNYENNNNSTYSNNKSNCNLTFSNLENNQNQKICQTEFELEAKNKPKTNKKQKRNVLGKSRKSQYRGVSKNGNQWQVLIMIRNAKRYVGSFASQELAARAYDKVAIQYHQTKAKTNFSYCANEITQILKEVPAIIVKNN